MTPPPPIAEAVVTEAAVEAAEQEYDQQDDENGCKRRDHISFVHDRFQERQSWLVTASRAGKTS
jgi:hypothetical protein